MNRGFTGLALIVLSFILPFGISSANFYVGANLTGSAHRSSSEKDAKVDVLQGPQTLIVSSNARLKPQTNNYASSIGLAIGKEFSLILFKINLEAFADLSLKTSKQVVEINTTYDGSVANFIVPSQFITNTDLERKNRVLYGTKSRFILNMPIVKPYLLGGVGIESVKMGFQSAGLERYTNGFWMLGIGAQANIFKFAAYVEASYLQSFAKRTISNAVDLRMQDINLTVGARYYF